MAVKEVYNKYSLSKNRQRLIISGIVSEMEKTVFLPGGMEDKSLLPVLLHEIDKAEQIIILSAFIGTGLHNVLIRRLEKAVESGKEIRILTSTMNNFNNPAVLRSLQKRVGKIRIYGTPGGMEPFHVKSWLFISDSEGDTGTRTLIIGSSNMTRAGLEQNVEWNVLLRDNDRLFNQALDSFTRYWDNDSFIPDELFYRSYTEMWNKYSPKWPEMVADNSGSLYRTPKPNSFQNPALKRLSEFREMGLDRALVIAATGTGKTFLSAFDFLRSKSKRLLFLVHRESILLQAEESFKLICGDSLDTLTVAGTSDWRSGLNTFLNSPGTSADGRKAVFAMVQTLSRDEHRNLFPEKFFDYIIVDEFHHAEAETYRRVLSYFSGYFLLGLTATPERSDGRDVAELCDYNIAFEVRLLDAVKQGLLAPFNYHAIMDPSDYRSIRWQRGHYVEEELESLLSNDTRARLAAENLKKILPPEGMKRRVLGFCVNRNHAQFMTLSFRQMGWDTECVLGDTPVEERRRIIQRLRDDSDPLEVIFSVDVFSEGTDIPEITHILLLRPTESFTLFLQQIGRGLRKCSGKSFVSILDLIGNYRGSFIPFLALRGFTSAARRVAIAEIPEEPKLPPGCFVDADTEVVQLQRDEIIRIFTPRRGKREILSELYLRKREELGRSPALTEFLIDPEVDDPGIFIKHYGGSWLRVKNAFEDLNDYEQTLLGGSGELLLRHLESELKPNKSYKMAILSFLSRTDADTGGWDIDAIAKAFKTFYIEHPHYRSDYSALVRYDNPADFPISEVRRHIINMPLRYLSDKPGKPFRLDIAGGKFFLRNEGEYSGLHGLWNDLAFKMLLNDRINYALKRYFFRKEKK